MQKQSFAFHLTDVLQVFHERYLHNRLKCYGVDEVETPHTLEALSDGGSGWCICLLIQLVKSGIDSFLLAVLRKIDSASSFCVSERQMLFNKTHKIEPLDITRYDSSNSSIESDMNGNYSSRSLYFSHLSLS